MIGEKKIHLKPLKSNGFEKKSNIKLYKKSNGEIVGVQRQLFIKLKSKNDFSFLEVNHLKLIKSYDKNLYLVELNTTDIFECIHRLDDNNSTLYVYPNFFRKVESR